tara:strand:- start:1374 stop:2246 length:873 start_codon:yes stop_codon:yes gene_type:complete
MAQTASTGSLENAQRIVVSAVRYTEEHNAPAMALTEQFTLGKGNKQVTVPKVGQMTVSDLTDGQDIIDSEEIGMTTVDLTASEVGAKVVLTDKLVRQSVPNVFNMVGRQLGDGMARKKDDDVTALYQNLNGGTALGATTKKFKVINATGCIAYAKANKFGSQLYMIHHPNAVADFVASGAVTPSITYPVPDGWSADLLKNFFVGLRPLNGVSLFEDGNISLDSNNDAYGAIADKGAIATLTSLKVRTERERDASLRGTELVMTADYGVFELDDSKGAPLFYTAAAPATNA